MKRFYFMSVFSLLSLLIVGLIWKINAPTIAYAQAKDSDIPLGGALFDNWFAAIGTTPPAGNFSFWDRQKTNTLSGSDTWRCVSCHGWDYQGKDGAYRSGSHFTGFPGVYQAGKTMSIDQIIGQLTGKRDPLHDFSPYLNQNQLNSLAKFLTTALINDNDYIDLVTLEVKGGNADQGKKLFTEQCASCHGNDGKKIKFRFEGIDAYLGTLAKQDPWRFLHKTRFGTPGTPMVIGYDLGWSPQEGRDVLLYAQSLPTGQETAEGTPVMETHPQVSSPLLGGPAQNFFTSILTAFSVMAAGLGFNILVAAVLIGIILLLVWAIRGRK